MDRYQGISNYLTYISEAYKLDICVNDFVGFLNNDSLLYSALQPFLIHKNPFCMEIKSRKELWDRCLAMKKGIRAKSQSLKDTYYGFCYCGIGEYIVPIINNDFVIGVICAGEFNSHPEISEYRIKKVAGRYGIDPVVLMHKFKLSTKKDVTDKKLINNLLGITAEYISGLCQVYVNEEKSLTYQDRLGLDTEAYVLSHALEYIKQNYSTGITLKNVSAFCHCSESYMSHLFKKKMKTNIKNYINNIRIDQAKILLLNSKLSIAEISFRVGFNDSNYFSSVFKDICGNSPTVYRKKGYYPLLISASK